MIKLLIKMPTCPAILDDVRAHGKDERIGVAAFYEGVEFMYRLIKALTLKEKS